MGSFTFSEGTPEGKKHVAIVLDKIKELTGIQDADDEVAVFALTYAAQDKSKAEVEAALAELLAVIDAAHTAPKVAAWLFEYVRNAGSKGHKAKAAGSKTAQPTEEDYDVLSADLDDELLHDDEPQQAKHQQSASRAAKTPAVDRKPRGEAPPPQSERTKRSRSPIRWQEPPPRIAVASSVRRVARESSGTDRQARSGRSRSRSPPHAGDRPRASALLFRNAIRGAAEPGAGPAGARGHPEDQGRWQERQQAPDRGGRWGRDEPPPAGSSGRGPSGVFDRMHNGGGDGGRPSVMERIQQPDMGRPDMGRPLMGRLREDGICRDFFNNRCRYGDRCKYSHDRAAAMGPDRGPPSGGGPGMGGPDAMLRKRPHPGEYYDQREQWEGGPMQQEGPFKMARQGPGHVAPLIGGPQLLMVPPDMPPIWAPQGQADWAGGRQQPGMPGDGRFQPGPSPAGGLPGAAAGGQAPSAGGADVSELAALKAKLAAFEQQMAASKLSKVEALARSVAVQNVHFGADEDIVAAHFIEACGKIIRVSLLRDAFGNARGAAYVQFDTDEGAKAALGLDGSQLLGRTLRVVPKAQAHTLFAPKPAVYVRKPSQDAAAAPGGNGAEAAAAAAAPPAVAGTPGGASAAAAAAPPPSAAGPPAAAAAKAPVAKAAPGRRNMTWRRADASASSTPAAATPAQAAAAGEQADAGAAATPALRSAAPDAAAGPPSDAPAA